MSYKVHLDGCNILLSTEKHAHYLDFKVKPDFVPVLASPISTMQNQIVVVVEKYIFPEIKMKPMDKNEWYKIMYIKHTQQKFETSNLFFFSSA